MPMLVSVQGGTYWYVAENVSYIPMGTFSEDVRQGPSGQNRYIMHRFNKVVGGTWIPANNTVSETSWIKAADVNGVWVSETPTGPWTALPLNIIMSANGYVKKRLAKHY